MKQAIDERLEHMSAQELEEVLDFLNKKDRTPMLRYDINSEIESVVKEDAALLKRLAQ